MQAPAVSLPQLAVVSRREAPGLRARLVIWEGVSQHIRGPSRSMQRCAATGTDCIVPGVRRRGKGLMPFMFDVMITTVN